MPRSQMKYKQSLLHAGQFSLASDYDLHNNKQQQQQQHFIHISITGFVKLIE